MAWSCKFTANHPRLISVYEVEIEGLRLHKACSAWQRGTNLHRYTLRITSQVTSYGENNGNISDSILNSEIGRLSELGVLGYTRSKEFSMSSKRQSKMGLVNE